MIRNAGYRNVRHARKYFPSRGLTYSARGPNHFFMKFLHTVLVSFALCLAAYAQEGMQDLKIGQPAPDFELLGIDGKMHKLAEYKEGKVLLIFFTSNHCPTSHGAEARIKKLIADYEDKGMTFVAINPNHPEGLSIDELGYSKYSDGYEDMKKYAAESGFKFPYLYDGETQSTAKAYGCLATPHVFIFDQERKLRYKGRFDDSRFAGDETVKSPDARNAVEALLAGKPVPVEVTRPHGCSTKWRTKQTGIAVAKERWDKTPVDVEMIDSEGVAKLRKNGTKSMRLFNVWSTTCVPCIGEFPELVTTARKFDMRDFQFINISMDAPSDAPKVKAFLERFSAGLSGRMKKAVKDEGRVTNSYIFKGTDMEELMKVLDPEWPGGMPHTVLVDTDGKVVWRHNGPVNGDELRAKILDHMGNYYKP
jgi:peroxiredoxin